MEDNERVEISWYSNDQIQDMKYYLGDEYHRDNNQPAFQSWFKNGNKMLEIYLVNGQTHRTNGPAFIEWFENGKPRNIEYRINNEIHREDGPAVQKFSEDEFLIELYFLDNIQYSKEDWIVKTRKLKLQKINHETSLH